MKIPEPMHTVASAIDSAHEAAAEPPRGHIGASQIGHSCDRWLWLSHRWFVQEKFPGRILRLFRRGRLEEEVVLADLRAIGCKLRETQGGQHRVDFGSHVSGSLDAIIESGLPGASSTPHVVEIKTHSKKSFDALEKEGVEKSKRLHYVQMQAYMHGTGIDRALYVAVCKDDDRLYTERIAYDSVCALRYIERAKNLAVVDEMPPPLSRDPSWYECKFCAAHPLCHGRKADVPHNCRTCRYSTATPESTWRCEKFDADVPLDFQRSGCAEWAMHDDVKDHTNAP